MQAAHDMDLGEALARGHARAQLVHRLIDREHKGTIVLGAPPRIRAQLARSHAHVGGIDMHVAIEAGDITVHPLAHLVGQGTDLHQVRVFEQRDAIGVGKRHSLAPYLQCPRGSQNLHLPFRKSLAGNEAGRPYQQRRFVAGKRVAGGLFPQAKRALRTDGAPKLVGAERQTELPQLGAQELHIGDDVGLQKLGTTGGEELQRIQALRFAERDWHNAADGWHTLEDGRQSVQADVAIPVGLACGKRSAKERAHAEEPQDPGDQQQGDADDQGERRRFLGYRRRIAKHAARALLLCCHEPADFRERRFVDQSTHGGRRSRPRPIRLQAADGREKRLTRKGRLGRCQGVATRGEEIRSCCEGHVFFPQRGDSEVSTPS